MKKKVIKISLFTIFITILTVFGIFNLINNISTAANGETSTQSSAKPGTLMAGEKNPNSYNYVTNFSEYVKTDVGVPYVNVIDGLWIPKINKDGIEYQVYCIQPDSPIVYNYELSNYYDSAFSEPQRNPQFISCPEKDGGAHAKYYTYQKNYVPASALQYISEKKHNDLYNDHYYTGLTVYEGAKSKGGQSIRSPVRWKEAGTTNLTEAMAYIVSDEPIGEWSEKKQHAIWNLHGSGLDNGLVEENTHATTSSSELDQECRDYAEYDKKVRPENGLKPDDLTKIDDVITKVDQESKKYTVGPYSVKYTEGIYGNIAFSGISKITIIGYDKNKSKIREGIEVEKIILKDKVTGVYEAAKKPEYFEPDKTLKVDETEQIYPASEQEFQVVFSDPNTGLSSNDPNRIAYISIKIEFKYMLANGKYTKYKGTKRYLDYSHADINFKPKYHLDCKHSHDSSCYSSVTDYDDDENAVGSHTVLSCSHSHDDSCYYDHFDCKQNKRITTTEKMQDVIAVDAIRSIYEQEIILTPDGGTDITMDIEGKVWEDEKSGKETLADGERADSEKPVNNIPVILYDDKDKVVEQTTTDSEGKYKFEKLDAMKKYYVEFKYNGQQYENTIYTDKLDDKHSVATETTSDRDSFNKKFEEIDGDEGYTVEQLRYDDERSQYYNAPGIFTLSAFTGSDGKNALIKYPKHDKFVIDEVEKTVDGITYKAVYDDEDSIKHMDFGITQRIEFDMALKKDLYVATVKINGKTEVYGYDKKLANTEDGQQANSDAGYAGWTINVVGGYDRSLDDADWNFKGQNGNKDGLLEVYATYKVAVRNQSMSMLGHATKVYDYYDSTFEYVPKLSWQSKTNYKNNKATRDKLQDSIEKGNVADWGTTPNASDDKNGTITIDVDKKQETGETQYIYLTFKLKNDSNGQVSLGNKTNKAEIGAFKTYYKGGKTTLPHYNGENSYQVTGDDMIAGRVDRDSIPSSMGKDGQPGKNELYDEDDEDTAPNLNVKLTGDKRILNGTAWEDERTVNEGNAMIGNGIMDNKETKIAGIEVQLVEKTVWDKNNPKGEYVWATTKTASDGTYSFDSYIPGDYVIRYRYGEGLSGADKNNGKSYNGQDYKTTTYQAGIDQTPTTDLDGKYKGYLNVNNQNETGEYGFNIATKKDNVSDAKDIWSVREKINNYSKTNVTNGIAEILAIPYETPRYNGNEYSKSEIDALRQELIKNTTATAESGVVVVEVERNLQSETENGNPSYKLKNLNIGLVERPKAQLEIDKSITNIKVTLANNTVLFDVNKKGDNVVWKYHTEYNLADKKKNNKYEEYYGQNGKNRYSYRDEVNKLVKNADKGLVQLTMDEELMHGATIEVTYRIKVTNDGEIDYDGKEFYYKGKQSGNVVTTNANQVVDYVANNLQFNKSDSRNNGWSVISKDDLTGQNLVNAKLTDNVSKFNTIIQTPGLSKDLKPGDVSEKTLVLSQLITAENKSDDLTYRNITEIVKTSNTVGRRMAYSIVGNQDPTVDAQEVDASVAEKVIILPPFGSSPIYYILGITIGLILIGGITLIIRKVLRK